MIETTWAANALTNTKREVLTKYRCFIADVVEIDLIEKDQDRATFQLLADTFKEAALKLGVTEAELEIERLKGIEKGAKLTVHHIERRLAEPHPA